MEKQKENNNNHNNVYKKHKHNISHENKAIYDTDDEQVNIIFSAHQLTTPGALPG